MKLVRNSCFETNSSSCHSITLSRDSSATYDSITPNNEGRIEVVGGEFGWDQETFYSPIDKLSYILIYVRDWVEGEDQIKFSQMIEDVVLKHTKANELRFLGNSDSDWGDGYIDHQSVEGRALDYLFEDESVLKDYLFNPGSYLETDNDNH